MLLRSQSDIAVFGYSFFFFFVVQCFPNIFARLLFSVSLNALLNNVEEHATVHFLHEGIAPSSNRKISALNIKNDVL